MSANFKHQILLALLLLAVLSSSVAGLSVNDRGELLLRDAPFRGIGVNYYDAFTRTLGPIARTLPIPMVATAYATWLSLHGLVWEELLGRLPGGLGDDGALYDLEASAIAERLGFRAMPGP